MWEYRNNICRHRSDEINMENVKDVVQNEEGAYVGLKKHTLGKTSKSPLLYYY